MPILQTLFLTVIVLSVGAAIALKAPPRAPATSPSSLPLSRKNSSKDDIAGAQELCRKQKGSVAAVVSAALVRYEEMDKNTILTKEQKVQTLRRRGLKKLPQWKCPLCSRICPSWQLSPPLGTLVGLLGTVIGMIKSFQALSASGAPDSTALSTGISGLL